MASLHVELCSNLSQDTWYRNWSFCCFLSPSRQRLVEYFDYIIATSFQIPSNYQLPEADLPVSGRSGRLGPLLLRGPLIALWTFNICPRYFLWAGIAQSVQRRNTGWTARVRFSTEARDLSLLHSVQTGSGAHPASMARTLTPGLKLPGLEADNSPPSSAEIWSYTSTPPYVFMAYCLIN
jgi:hypothetical protein